MLKLLFPIVSVLAVLLFAVCAADRGDILSLDTNEYGGRLTQGMSRPNLIVNNDNIHQACQKIITPVFIAFENALPVVSGSEASRVVRVPGTFHGFSEVSGISTMREDHRNIDFNLEITFYDYSDSGLVFLGGRINCVGEMMLMGNVFSARRLYFDGGMAFAGDFQGSVVFDSLQINLDGSGRPYSTLAEYCEMDHHWIDGKLALTSGGKTIVTNPWFRVPVICYASP